MLFICVSDNGHKRICEYCDEDGNNQEVADKQKQCQYQLSEGVVVVPSIPSSGSEAHEYLQQCVSHGFGRVQGVIAERQAQCDEETAAADEDQQKDRNKILGHHPKGDQQLREILVVIEN
jgi:hypothetical protein